MVPAAIWVGARVPLRFWTNGTVIGTFYFFTFFSNFLSAFERPPNCNDYKLNDKLRD